MNKNIVSTILKGIAVALAVAVIVLGILGTLSTETGTTLLALGLLALGLNSFQN
jgi:hypothetical protein